MSDHDTGATGVLDTLRDSLGDVTMRTPVEQIMAAGRARRRRHRLAGVAAGAAAATGLALGVATYVNPSTAPPTAGNGSAGTSIAAGAVHIHTAAYTVDSKTDGTVHVTWDKRQYFQDRAGLQAALREAGFPVLIKVGEFCTGPHDNGKLDPSGVGPGVDSVMKGRGKRRKGHLRLHPLGDARRDTAVHRLPDPVAAGQHTRPSRIRRTPGAHRSTADVHHRRAAPPHVEAHWREGQERRPSRRQRRATSGQVNARPCWS